MNLAVQAEFQSHQEASVCSDGAIWICAEIMALMREEPEQSPGPVIPPAFNYVMQLQTSFRCTDEVETVPTCLSPSSPTANTSLPTAPCQN